MKKQLNRRLFLQSSAAAAAFPFFPRTVLGMAPSGSAGSRRLNIAGVGVGGMGQGNLNAVAGTENIVALCDVDWNYAKGTFEKYPQAKRYKDYRVMLEEMGKEIDAVIIATPDHTHACIAMECMKRGKHVYVQKPLTKTVYEARMLTEAARKYGVITQMGNQGHSDEGIRLICEWIWDGAIGDVREVHAWTNRPVWPQGLDRPSETPPVPDTLDWDLWLGPAPYRPYHPAYHPWNWRAWVDFGTGALGDMACHILDPVFWALKLKYPVSVQGSYVANVIEKWKKQDVAESYPLGSIIHLDYPAREGMPAVKVHWYDGGLMPERPEELEEGRRMGDNDGGVLFVGDKGKLMCGCYGKAPQLIPYSRMQEYKRPPKTLPRVQTSHEMNWVNAIKEGKKASCDFDYAGPFTEMVLMGNLCLFKPGQKILWDGETMKSPNMPDLDKYVNPPYREGWHL
ncbi:MAG TPA: Gfo/Idh/MocA family oxidoreductase [Anaerohalosphaeraceae bacterium]|nr:Gfo/Idh/MocA family oxidoreductase [Anaerohalosphaeraceae bacterium]HOM76223.1 Gfo/Idh/MocA family oxidoreductase [Anaerohalosphaeraceae bacterium]HPC63959.1 Gfo/Idh/MocA family oxidoreductase [Anaerohalosphaeraceae bacterium]HRS70380.1 Gfo/Idh/MocA family oxidoreductase [Anaerohalosphaeraceae bacterium]HRV20263.1 Gfo/Idh/MocA family oxidoreductase [Anaerohalosphaeraceae bacterium]